MKKKVLLLLSTLTIFCRNVIAQHTSLIDTTIQIDEVVVKGSVTQKLSVGKLNLPITYLPLSTSTISSPLLEQQGITDLQSAIRYATGGTIRTSYGAYQQLQVRGYDYMPILIDGVRDERTSITNSAPLPDISSAESIELLKGPASVLYGHSAVGGILNITRKAPTDTPIFHTLFSYGSWNNKRAMIDLGGPLIGSINYRSVINWQSQEGYRMTNDKRFSGYLALSTTLPQGQEIEIRGGFNRDWYGTEIGLPPLMPYDIYKKDSNEKYLSAGASLPNINRKNRYNNESDFMIHNGSNALLRYTKYFSPKVKIENRLAYNYDNIDYFSTEELSYRTSTDSIYPYYYIAPGQTTKTYIDIDSVQLTYPLGFAYTVHVINEQLEASGKLVLPHNIKWDYLAGYNLVVFNRDTYRRYGGGYSLSQLIDGPGLYSVTSAYSPQSMGYMKPYFGSGTSNRNITHGVYLHNVLHFSDQFKIMLSGRWDYYAFKTASQTFAQRIEERPKYKNITYSKTSTDAFTYRVGAVYLPHKHTSIYTSASNFYMPHRDVISPTVIYINNQGKRFYPTDGNVFKPQTGYQAEVGIRHNPHRYLQATAAIFLIRRNNEKKTLAQGVVEDGVRKSVVGVVGRSQSKGFEIDIQSNPINGLHFHAGYSFIDASIRNLATNDYLNIDPQKGMRQIGVPKNTFLFTANCTPQHPALKRITLFASTIYTDNIIRNANKSVIYPAYWLINAGCSYQLNHGISLRANVYNIGNESYVTQSIGTQLTPSAPRNYLLTLSYTM